MNDIRPGDIELPPTVSIDVFGVEDAGHNAGTGRQSTRERGSS